MITNIRAVEIVELEVEASMILLLKIADQEGGAASEVALMEIANAGSCGGDARPD